MCSKLKITHLKKSFLKDCVILKFLVYDKEIPFTDYSCADRRFYLIIDSRIRVQEIRTEKAVATHIFSRYFIHKVLCSRGDAYLTPGVV